ncbi:hypothetical protein L596_002801 [Steinernema carpocapsae]|uniref:Uncharacterized protein n=1 Tax=Steinernema carpocapsae TaxID=34508 RepID=A0A4U8UT81_STECR|nr:hypothetical protein L596_002801 [Steinernema carpocapsae]
MTSFYAEFNSSFSAKETFPMSAQDRNLCLEKVSEAQETLDRRFQTFKFLFHADMRDPLRRCIYVELDIIIELIMKNFNVLTGIRVKPGRKQQPCSGPNLTFSL